MPIHFSNAPGKIILFGEHAVVYGYPAIAIPLNQLKATARIVPEPSFTPGTIQISAPQINLQDTLTNLPENHPIAAAVRLGVETAQVKHIPAITIQITSSIPIAAGLGSSAAVTIAILRALTSFFGIHLSNERISNLAFEVEKIQHGTPSGIDNNVIAHQQPVFYKASQPIEFLHIRQPSHWIVADTGQKSSTKQTVADVRLQYEADQKSISAIFTKIGRISEQARQSLITGEIDHLGKLMNENQQLLEALNVSSEPLNTLIQAARSAGAAGAKLSGGGRGGNLIVLAAPGYTEQITNALLNAGAKQVFSTVLNPGPKK